MRLEVMRRLVAEGFDVGVAIAPILPALTDSEADLEALVASVAAAGVRRLSWRLLFLQSPTREKYLEWLRRELAASARALGLSGLYSRLPRR